MLELCDRISWKQASEILGCSKSSFFRLVQEGLIPAYGALDYGRFYLRSDCKAYLQKKREQRAKKLASKKKREKIPRP